MYKAVIFTNRTAHRKRSLIARFMGPTWGPTGADRAPCWPHELCYLGCQSIVTGRNTNIFQCEWQRVIWLKNMYGNTTELERSRRWHILYIILYIVSRLPVVMSALCRGPRYWHYYRNTSQLRETFMIWKGWIWITHLAWGSLYWI